jgi:hypothetical protein
MSDASANSPSMALFHTPGLACCRSKPIARAGPRKSDWVKRGCRRASAEYQVDTTEEQLKNAPKLGKNEDWDWSERARDQEVYDYWRVTYYWGAEQARRSPRMAGIEPRRTRLGRVRRGARFVHIPAVAPRLAGMKSS